MQWLAGVCQIVGVCEEELKVSQRWNGPGILNLIKTIPLYDSFRLSYMLAVLIALIVN